MRIELACFSDRGQALGTTLVRMLGEGGDAARLECCGGTLPVRRWTADRFREADALIFIGAVGIAVRAVAPELASKTSDPAVVVVDDRGRFAISLLSGHIGGANALAERIASLIAAAPVITTATDINGVFAIDTWAQRNGLAILNPERIKSVSSRLLAGDRVGLASDFPVAGTLPGGFIPADGEADADVVVAIRRPARSDALLVAPRVAILGVGCRKGTSAEAIEAAFSTFCEAGGILPQAFGKVCSIDLKQDEPGLVAFCAGRRLPFETFGAEALMAVEGDFAASDFVKATTGADNVCERSAVAGGGRLLLGKTVVDGIAMAVAVREYALDFSGGGEEKA